MPHKDDCTSILLTGATGYIGRRLAPRLVGAGTRVHALVREGSETAQLIEECPSINVWRCTADNESVRDIIHQVQPTIVYHLATKFVGRHKSSDIDDMLTSTLSFGVQVADAAASTGSSCHFINVSTIWQHYENATYRPTSLYASMKQAFEDILVFYASLGELRVTTLVLGDTYGPGDTRPKLLNLFRQCARTGALLPMTQGEQQLDLLHVDDAVQAFLVAKTMPAARTSSSSRFMLRTAECHSVREVAALYESTFNLRLNLDWGAISYPNKVMMAPPTLGDILPDWFPKYSLAEGLRTLEAPHV